MHTQSALSAGSHAAGQRSAPQSSAAPAASAPAASSASPAAYRGADLAAELLKRLFHRLPGTVNLRLWDGTVIRAGAGADGSTGTAPGAPFAAAVGAQSDAVVGAQSGAAVGAQSGAGDAPFTLVFRNPETVSAAVLGRDPLALAEAYFRGDLDIEGDFFAALSLKDHLDALNLPLRDKLAAVFTALRLKVANRSRLNFAAQPAPSHGRHVKAHSKAENRDAIRFHYDVSNEFYALWLDRAMVYSCAYFETRDADLDDAQQAKLEHICRKLSLKPGEEFLDIGCGWGALVIHAARHYGVRAHGVTLSPRQLQVARERIEAAGLADRVTVELLDYRDLEGECVYDKVASVGMFEHVGLKNLPVYFSTVHRLLKPRGLFLNHGITHEAEGWQANASTEFINRYVFPDGQLDTISNIQRAMERAKLEIADVESLRMHYAMTLRRWVARLEANRPRALQYVNEATYRVWRLYMTACALQFDSGEIGIYQVLANKRTAGRPDLPLTRRHLYT